MEHDRVLLVLDGDKARHTFRHVYVRSFSSFTEDFSPSSGEMDHEVLAIHTRAWTLVFCVFSFISSGGILMRILLGVILIVSLLRVHASFWVLRLCCALLTNSPVLLNPL
jgi:hypothetical protein